MPSKLPPYYSWISSVNCVYFSSKFVGANELLHWQETLNNQIHHHWMQLPSSYSMNFVYKVWISLFSVFTKEQSCWISFLDVSLLPKLSGGTLSFTDIWFAMFSCCWLNLKMGKILSKIFGNKEMRILMLGLDAAGKTSNAIMLQKLSEQI